MNVKKQVYDEVINKLNEIKKDIRYAISLRKRNIKKMAIDQAVDKRSLVEIENLIKGMK